MKIYYTSAKIDAGRGFLDFPKTKRLGDDYEGFEPFISFGIAKGKLLATLFTRKQLNGLTQNQLAELILMFENSAKDFRKIYNKKYSEQLN